MVRLWQLGMSETAPLKYARGSRPQFFDDPSVDALLVAVLELAQDVSVLRDRLDSYEHFIETQGVVTRAAFEAHQIPADMQSAQAARRKDFIERLLRAIEKI
jgi:hypothetical protein